MLERIFSTSFYSIVSRVFFTGANLFCVFYISRYLSEKELGIYGISFFFFQLFGNISSMGLNVFIGKEVAYLRESKEKVFDIFNELVVASLYGSGISLLLILISLFTYNQLNPTLLVLSFVAGCLSGMGANLGGFLLGKERMNSEALFNCISFVIVVGLIVGFHDFGIGIETIFVIRIISLFVGVLARLLFIKKDIRFSRLILKLKHFKESKFYWFSQLNYFILSLVDVFILSFFIDKSLLGGYFLSIRIYVTVCVASEVISLALTPFISRSFKGKESINFNGFIKKTFFYSMGCGILLGVFLYFSRDFLIAIFNEKLISDCTNYLKILAFIVPFRFGIYILGSIMSSSEFQKIRFYISLSMAGFFIVAVLGFTYFWSSIGAVFAKALTELLLFCAYFYFNFFKIKTFTTNEHR